MITPTKETFLKQLRNKFAKAKGISEKETYFPNNTLEVVADIIWEEYGELIKIQMHVNDEINKMSNPDE